MSSKRNITYKCPYCEKRFNKENLVIHVGDKHDDMIPQGYTAFRLVFDYINKKPAGYNGKCIICGNETGWDENKGKYNRLCNNPECKKKYVKQFEDRMMKSKGVTRISSTPEGQTKMLANRKISGEYKFQDGGIKTYTGTYEKKALEFMDKVMNIKSEDVTTPGPIMEYIFEGKKHIYISDIYYVPYNLIIEVKDGGDNPNNRSMPEYRAKQIAKEKYIIKNTDFNYLRLTNNDFSQLLAAFMELKMEMSNDTPERVIRINEGIITDRLKYSYKYGQAKKINKELADKINSTDYPWYFINLVGLNGTSLDTLDITLYGYDEEPVEGVDKIKYKSHYLYNKKVKGFHGTDSLNPALRKYTKFNKGAAKTKDVVLKEEYIEESNNELSFKSDKDLLEWMKKNIKYSNYTKLKSHDEVLKSKKGSCHDQVMFEYEELKKLGYSPKGLFVLERDKNNQGGTTHSLIYYKKGNKICWFEHAWEGQEGIGEHNSLSDIKNIIKDMYNNYGWGNLRKYGYLEFKTFSISSHKPGESLQQFIDKCFGESINEGYIEEISRSDIKSEFLEKGDSCYNLDKWPDQYNILFVTGISGSGKTTLGIDLAKEYNCGRVELDYIAVYYLRKCKERNAYDKFRSKLQNDCPEAVEFFDLNPPEKYGLREKWADTGDILTDFCNWFVTKFGNNGKPYIINGSYIYEIFDVNFFYDKPLIIKDINIVKTVFRRTWREFNDHSDASFFRKLEYGYKAFKTGLSKEYRKANKDFKSYRKDMNKNAELVESYIEEGFLKSEPDILYNKEAFDNGDINICFVIGLSGSGKTTFALSKANDRVDMYSLDDLWCIKDHFTMKELKDYGDLIYSYFSGPGKKFYITYDELQKQIIPGSEYEDKLIPNFIDYAIKWAKNHKNKKYIIEGIWIISKDDNDKPYFDPSYFKDYAFYIKGTSIIKSRIRAAKRDSEDAGSKPKQFLASIQNLSNLKIWKYYILDEKLINKFRDYFKDKLETILSESYIEESKVSKKYYHVSQSNLNGKTLQPSIPNNYFTKNGYEDNKTKRVCFTNSIDNCLRALSQKCTGMELYVHILDGNYNIYTPSIDEVPDCKVTGEVWVTKPCKVKCIGKIKVIGDRGEDGLPFKYGNKTAELYDWDWEWIEQLSESYIEEAQNNTLSTSQIKAILKKISDKVKSDSKPPTGNQNCMLCTWCLEAQLRGYNILPRPVYSPRDIIFKQVPYNIVKNPEKLKIRNKNDVTKQVLGTGNGSRYYVHVNWKGGSGGHEFIIMNINNKVYVLDAQQNEMSDINISVNGLSYFNDINYANSYIIRLDDKELNKDILKYNDNKYIIEWDDVKDPEYMKSDEYLNEASMSDYKFLDIKSNKSKALEYLKANSETKSYAEDTIKNYNGELVIYNDTMIGRILVGDKKDKGFITDFSIDEEHRGNKLGSKLIDDAINKYHGVDLLVDKDNDLAIGIYKRRGFVIVKTYKNQYYMKLESKLKEDTIMMNEAMNALMTGYIPGSVDNPNNTYIVNYMQNNVFSGEDPNEDCIGVSSDPLFTNMIIRDKNGMLKRVDESFLKDKDYKVYIIEKSIDEVNNLISANIGNFVKYGYLYETLTGKKLYSKDQVGLEGVLIPVMDYYKSMDIFKEICDNYFQAKDKKEESINESSFIPKEVRYFNNSGLMYSDKVYNLNDYINSKPNKVLECLDITISEGIIQKYKDKKEARRKQQEENKKQQKYNDIKKAYNDLAKFLEYPFYFGGYEDSRIENMIEVAKMLGISESKMMNRMKKIKFKDYTLEEGIVAFYGMSSIDKVIEEYNPDFNNANLKTKVQLININDDNYDFISQDGKFYTMQTNHKLYIESFYSFYNYSDINSSDKDILIKVDQELGYYILSQPPKGVQRKKLPL